jgi:predicted N-formylglutamate amidohydrolase
MSPRLNGSRANGRHQTSSAQRRLTVRQSRPHRVTRSGWPREPFPRRCWCPPESIPDISELIRVPGNIGLNEGGKAARVREIFRPYHDRIESELDRRRKAGRPAALIAMHSFTPVFMGVARPWHAGVLYNRDPRFAHLFVALLKREEGLVVGNNEPYDVNDATDYTIPVHGERRGLHHVAIEIRQDLIVGDQGQRTWAALLARLLPQAYQELVAAEALGPA